MAERANLIAPRNPGVMDTLGWIKHLLGDDQAAVKLVTDAALVVTGSADTQLHAAIVNAAVGRLEEAEQIPEGRRTGRPLSQRSRGVQRRPPEDRPVGLDPRFSVLCSLFPVPACAVAEPREPRTEPRTENPRGLAPSPPH